MSASRKWTAANPAVRDPRPWAAFAWIALLLGGGLLVGLIPAPAAGSPLQPPSGVHWLGTDMLGRDFGWRMIAGGARTFLAAFGAAAISILLGGLWGIAAGFAGGWADRILSRLMDAALAVPALILGLVILSALGPGEAAVILALGLGGAATFARLLRAEARQIRSREYLLAARTLGAGKIRLVVRHLLPNISGSLAAYGALHFGWAMVNVASLTFLGFGGAPSVPEWGRMLAEARLVFGQAPGQALAAGGALALTVVAVQRTGEWWLEKNRR
ncbi:MAG: ABC transporter permease [Anaerolineales bacterium]|nr:ABC transporter permease [Anaerolineales bacterium]